MKSLKGRIALTCTIGIYAMANVAYAEPDTFQITVQEDKILTPSSISFFDISYKQKSVGPEILLLGKPAKENDGQYITLSEPAINIAIEKPAKKLTVKQSFAVKPSLIFNMGNAGLMSASPSGFSDFGAVSTGNHVTFSYGTAGETIDPKALGISIGSQFISNSNAIMSSLYDSSEFDNINNRQVYNLSVGMGYAGFTLGASFSQEKKLYDSGLKGFDVGLGYSGGKWGADVKFGEYKRERDLLFASTEEFFNTVYALEIGAAYQIHSNIHFTGRFTYYSYGQESELDKIKNSQVFFLGTNVNF